MFSKFCHYLGIVSCIGLIAACFMPWVHNNVINDTLTGFHVPKFEGGRTYGRAGIYISVLTAIIFIFMLIPKTWAKRANLFIAAFLFAYCIRTYILFTGSTFEEEVENKMGIYLVIVFAAMILVSTVFPKLKEKQLSSD